MITANVNNGDAANRTHRLSRVKNRTILLFIGEY
jgi:hypothetical protein